MPSRPSLRVPQKVSLSAISLALALLTLPFPARAIVGVEYQLLLGNPSAASADTNNHDHYLIQRSVESLDYSDRLGLPLWASWNLTASDIGTNDRSSFITDATLPASYYHVKTSDYTGSGYDRGHLCPSKDRTDTAANNDLVFYMSNIMPQSGANNSGVWLQFENYCRDLVQSSNQFELLILCGPSGFSDARINTNGPVAIPDYVWKIVVVLPPGVTPATNRITSTNRVIALKIPNTDYATNAWPSYITSANQIQVDTGFTFFSALPESTAAILRAKVDGQTNSPPVITQFTPVSGPAGTSVTITGSGFSGASEVAFNGVTASYSIDSSTQVTAVVPTNASSGAVSITTLRGTAISTNSFTALTNGGSIYSGVLAAWDFSGVTGFGISPFAPVTNAPKIIVGGLTRGSGIRTGGTAAAGGWGGAAFTNLTAVAAIGASQYAILSLTALPGYRFSCSSITRLDYYRSSSGATGGVLQAAVGSGPFIDITNLSYSISGSGSSIGAIDLSKVEALQNVGAGLPVTIRLVNFGGTSSLGTWYFYNTQNSTAADLSVSGTVVEDIEANLPAVLSIRSPDSNLFTVKIGGANGGSYVLQCATNLASPIWVTLVTNTAPFAFSVTNSAEISDRFYRALSAP